MNSKWSCCRIFQQIGNSINAEISDELDPFDFMCQTKDKLTLLKICKIPNDISQAFQICKYNSDSNQQFKQFLGDREISLILFIYVQDKRLYSIAQGNNNCSVITYEDINKQLLQFIKLFNQHNQLSFIKKRHLLQNQMKQDFSKQAIFQWLVLEGVSQFKAKDLSTWQDLKLHPSWHKLNKQLQRIKYQN